MLTSCGLRRRDRAAAARRQLDGLLQHRGSRLRDRRPRQQRADPPRFGAGRRQPLRLLDVAADRVGERLGVAERHELAGPGGEHVLRVPVRRRDDAAAGGDPEGERARGDLLAPAVRRHEDVGGGEQVGDLVDREEAVVELDVVLEPKVDSPPARASAGTARPRGVRRPGVSARRSRRARPDGARRSTAAPRSPSRSPSRPRSARTSRAGIAGRRRRGRAARRRFRRALQCIGVRALREHGRRAVGYDANLVGGARVACDEQPSAPSRSSRSPARPDGTARRAPRPDASSAPRAPCGASRRAAARAPPPARARRRRRAPPKIPYSCWSRTTSTSSRPRIRAART